MADIFISFRRGGSGLDQVSAVLLHQQLGKHFSVFLDQETLRPGDKWPTVIEQEAARCEVFIALVGPDWASDHGLGRLNDDEDWVRKELLLTFRLKRAVVIPVVIIDRQAFKQTMSKLPEPLKALTDDQAVFIDRDKLTGQIDDLCQHLQQILAERQPRQGASPVLLQLPYLCDRVQQVTRLEAKLLDASDKVLAYVLSGRELDGHQAFMDRLKATHVIENAFQAASEGVRFCPLDFEPELVKQKGHAEFLRWAIKQWVLQKPRASDDQVKELLRNPGVTTVLTLDIFWADRQACGDDLVPALIQAWFGLFTGAAVVPSRPMLFWINLACPEDQQPEVQQTAWALPNLTPIGQNDIGRWLAMPEVRQRMVRFEARLRTLHTEREWLRPPPDSTLSMLKFALAVESITSAA